MTQSSSVCHIKTSLHMEKFERKYGAAWSLKLYILNISIHWSSVKLGTNFNHQWSDLMRCANAKCTKMLYVIMIAHSV